MAGSRSPDITGQRFGSRVALSRVETPTRAGSRWLAQCDCGHTSEVPLRSLTESRVCLYCRNRKPTTSALPGTTFGQRSVLAISVKPGYRVVQCSCGDIRDVQAGALEAGVGDRCPKCYHAERSAQEEAKRNSGAVPQNYWHRVETNAAARGLKVEITREDAEKLWAEQGGVCALTGWRLTWSRKQRATASLDRIDSTQGYVHGNVQWVHKEANRCKMAMSNDEFIEMCRAVAERNPL